MLLAREMGVNLTPAVIGKQLPFTAPVGERAWRWFVPHPQARPARTNYGSQERLEKKYGSTGRCSQLWEDSEMGLQRKICARI